jgi:hypothetical protein
MSRMNTRTVGLTVQSIFKLAGLSFKKSSHKSSFLVTLVSQMLLL